MLNEICHSGLIGYLKRVLVNGPHLKEWACGSVLVMCRFCVLVAYRLPAFRFTGVCRAFIFALGHLYSPHRPPDFRVGGALVGLISSLLDRHLELPVAP